MDTWSLDFVLYYKENGKMVEIKYIHAYLIQFIFMYPLSLDWGFEIL